VNSDEWNASTDPKAMLNWVREQGKASDRKLRLFACACCHRVWSSLADEASRRAVHIAEEFALDRVTADELARAQRSVQSGIAWCATLPESWDAAVETQRAAAAAVAKTPAYSASAYAAQHGASPAKRVAARDAAWFAAHRTETYVQSQLLRCLFGNPLQQSRVDCAWFKWRQGTIRDLLHTDETVTEHGFLSILADALEEAGCTESELLGHLRGPGPQAIGCWALGLLLGEA
jgi:hypothetical protein